MIKKIKIEYILSALLVLVAIFSIWGKRVTLLRLDTNYQNSISTLEDNFRTLYLSKHLRVLSHNLNIHGTRHFLTKSKADEEKLEENRKAFFSTIKTLETAPAFTANEARRELERLATLQLERSKFLGENINLSFKEKQAILLSPRVKEKNEELRYWLDHLITSEINYYNKTRESLLEYKDQVMEENNLISFFLILISLSFAAIVFKLSRMLRLSHKDALKAIKSRDDILAVVSHDLKNPLSAISLNTELMIKRLGGGENEKTLRSLTQIKKAVETMKDLLQDLLDQAKLESGKIELDFQKENFQEVLKEAEDLLIPISQSKTIEVVNHVPSNPIIVEADKKRLKQILSNLISNALKFSRESGKVEIITSVKEDKLKVSIHDNGPGIAENDLPHVFDRFWQAKKTAKKGTGLGLAIVKGLVGAHGGNIWVESKPGEGATFSFTIPLQQR